MNLIDPRTQLRDDYDVVAIGSGFGTSFFLHGLLRSNPSTRVLVLEWGDDHAHTWQIEQQRNSAIDCLDTFEKPEEHKIWNYNIGFGGGTNCWWGQTPRFHPSDFELKTRYGVGRDWPVSYDDLEPYYADAEAIMAISGDPDMAAVYPRSQPFPQPSHRPSSADQIMKAAQPEAHFVVPTARARIATAQRGACCAFAKCNLCPMDAKFTAHNGLADVYDDGRVEVALNCRALSLETANGSITGVVFRHQDQVMTTRGALTVLGANAIQSPHILQRSGIDDPLIGKGLHEQISFSVEVLLDGLDHFDGSTITTGMNIGLYDGDFRRDSAAALVYFHNHWLFGLRAERGRWRQTLPLFVIVEDLPQDANTVESRDASDLPFVTHAAVSDYARRGGDRALAALPALLAPLPVEAINFRDWQETGSHLQGTLRMGLDPATSVVDDRLVHHRYRNLVIVGTAVFPSCSCANPSLTAAALSLRAAERI